MISVVLRAASAKFDVKEFLSRFPKIEPDAIWEVGDKRLRSRPPSDDSGFNVEIGGGASWEEAWDWTRKWLIRLQVEIEELVRLGAQPCVDIGVLSEGPRYEILQVSLGLADLQYLAQLGVEVFVTVYPTNQEGASDA